ncbi:tetratricopeptide repeat protein [Kitasatospora terrestris]
MAGRRGRMSRAEALRRRAGAQFVGRRAQLALFAENLARDPDPEAGPSPADFLFHVRGMGGVGKSTLVAQWREAARRAGAVTALVDEGDVHGLESALGVLARQLAEQAGPLREFDRALEQYRRALQADRTTEQGGEGASLPARLVTTAVIGGVASAVPGGGVVAAMANPETVAQAADRLVAGVRQRRSAGGDEEAALCRAFVAELGRLCGRENGGRRPWVVLFFDTWEVTGRHLDAWLRDVLSGEFGDLPLEVQFVLAGRDELAERDWGPLRPAVVDVPLEVFTEQEARELLAARGVVDVNVVDAVLRMSMRLPLLVALLAQTRPQATDEVTDAGADLVDQAVERFLLWVRDPARRETVLAASLPPQLNRDVFARAVPGAPAGTWDWLLDQPFVTGHGEYRQYHAAVRASMLRYCRSRSPLEWRAAHWRLAAGHADARAELERRLSVTARRTDPGWQRLLTEETYHLLCADPSAQLADALEQTARRAGEAPAALAAWGDMLVQAAIDCGDEELTRWAARLHALRSPDGPHVETLSALAEPGLPARVRGWALCHRGYAYFLADRDDEALVDLDRAVSIGGEPLAQALAFRGRLHGWHNRDAQAVADLTASLELRPDDAWVLTRRGEAHRQAGRLDEAVADLTAAHLLDPDDAWYLAERGETHRRAGRFEQAVEDFTAALVLEPEYAWALGWRGEAHRQAGRLDEAMTDLTASIAIDAEQAWVFGARGQTHRQAGRLDEAIEDFTTSVELDPQYAWAWAWRGETHRQAERLTQAADDLGVALRLDPGYGWALARRGETHRQAGRLEEAMADLTAAVTLDPEDAWALGSRGQTHRQAGRLAEAVTDFTAAIELDPEYAWAFTWRGEVHRICWRLDEAIADFTAALVINPAYAWALARRGETHRQAERLEEAMADLDAALELDPEDAWALGSRGQTHRQALRLDAAVTDFTAAVELDPEYGWAFGARGEVHRIAGRFDAAVADYTAALTIDPDDSWSRARRGEALRLAGRLDDAVADFTAVLATDPDDDWVLGSRGQAHSAAGRLDDALADYTAALDSAPDDTWWLCLLAVTYCRLGRFADAWTALDAATQAPDDDLPAAKPARADAAHDSGAADDPHRATPAATQPGEDGTQSAGGAAPAGGGAEADESGVLLARAVVRLLESGPGAAETVALWDELLASPLTDPDDPVEPVVKDLLHGLAVRDDPPEALAAAFLALPNAGLMAGDMCAFVEELLPPGPRTAAVLALLRAAPPH